MFSAQIIRLWKKNLDVICREYTKIFMIVITVNTIPLSQISQRNLPLSQIVSDCRYLASLWNQIHMI